uniref:F-box domain-containing protein n=1 Tax=Setaria italica TaxID=4555 RepID=K3Z4V6_SETIT
MAELADLAAAAEAPAPSLLSLCLDAVAAHLTRDSAGVGADRNGWAGGCCSGGGPGEFAEEVGEEAYDEHMGPEQVAEALPWELLHRLASRLPPAALESLHHAAHAGCEDFNTAWQSLFKLRWPLGVNAGHDSVAIVDWQQQYWEKHLQECLDEAAESAFLPSFCGGISESSISAKIMNFIYRSEDIPRQHSRLTNHLSRFGCYTRCLRLQGVLCTAETYLYPAVMDKICKAVLQEGSQSHGIKQFSIKSSRICETKPLTISAGLLKFLSSGKSLHLLSLHDTKMQSSFAQMIIHTLLESSCGLQTLEISENNIAGWLSKLNRSSTSSSLALKSNNSLNSLSVVNLRGNNLQQDDVVDLHKILIQMPNLRDLDISGNPIMDEGIRSLVPFISWAIQKENPLLKLRVENCDLSSIGVSELLECLTYVKQPLDVLSIADNPLGSSVAAVLAKFLGSHVRDLNIEDIDLGALGFQILEEALPMEVALSHINISKNRGGIRAAYFVSKLILQTPNLVSVNAAANILPPESLEVICNTLKQRTCNLERVDLTGNFHLSSTSFPAFLEFKKHGKPILVVPSNLSTCAPYDDDP